MKPQAKPSPIVEPLFAKVSNLGDQTYEQLRQLLLSRQLPGGMILPEGRLAERLQVSRTPMREALVRLVGEGLLERTSDRAYRVRAVSTREFFECMQLRELLECHAIEMAVPRLGDEDIAALRRELRALPRTDGDDMAHWQFDNRFHTFFAKAANQETLARSIAQMRVIARLFRISSELHRKTENDEEHLAILDAVERRDAAAAKAAMLAHLRNLQDEVRRSIEADANPGRLPR
jgi:DNA-binding GntR family transcriptional regulator